MKSVDRILRWRAWRRAWRDKNKDYRSKLRERQISKGLCTECGKNNNSTYKCCSSCRNVRADQARKRRARNPEKRRAYQRDLVFRLRWGNELAPIRRIQLLIFKELRKCR